MHKKGNGTGMPFILSNWVQYGLSMVIAFVAAFLMTPIVKKAAIKADVIDRPGELRRVHSRPIPKLGGLAIAVGFFSAVLFNVILDACNMVRIMPPSNQLIGFLIGLSIIIIMGSLDDLYNLNPKYKFAFQFLAAGVIVFSGTRISTFTNPFSETGFSHISPAVSVIVTLLWIVGLTNAINFIDGLDGLAAGISTISLISLFTVSMLTGTPEVLAVSLLTAMLIGATMGFLPYNVSPAKIFMTDVGSNFLGFSLAVVTIQGAMKSYAAIALAIPITVLALPLFDVIFAIIRRFINRQKITEADRGHIHHRLIDIGLSHTQAVLILYTASIILGVVAVVLALISNNNVGKTDAIFAIVFLLALLSAFLIIVYILKSINAKNKNAGEEKENHSDAGKTKV